ncbi:hypothetical protein ES705_14824 [subsurface metagenome]
MEEFQCPVEGCEHEPFKTETALKSHLRSKHPDSVPQVETREVPIVEEDFATLLRKYKIKGDLAANIAEHISHTGGPSVFEKPELLLKGLVAWSSDIAPAKRKLIMTRWFAEKQIDIPTEVQQTAGMPTDQIQKAEAEKKGSAEVRYVYDEEAHVVRMAKKDEVGGTLAQAKELLKMAEEREKAGTESPFMQDAEGHWILNPKARVSGVELMAVQFMQQAQAKGEPVDPITAMTRAAETWKTLREGLGVGAGTQPAWMTDPVAFVGAIKTITGQEGLGGGAGTLPTWMTDPVAFVEAIKTITGQEGLGGGAGTQPAWMTDPVAFVETIRKISGGTEGDSALKEALTEMRQSVDEMKEQRYQDQFTSQQKQIQEVTNVLKQTLETISDLQKGRVGRTEMDIIHEIVTGGKEELSGLRKDVKEAFTSSSLPPAKSGEEREGRKRRVKKALKTDQDIEEIGQRMFFPQG